MFTGRKVGTAQPVRIPDAAEAEDTHALAVTASSF